MLDSPKTFFQSDEKHFEAKHAFMVLQTLQGIIKYNYFKKYGQYNIHVNAVFIFFINLFMRSSICF